MIYLILCIISSTLIFIIFKFISNYKIPELPVIVYNYFTASIMGFVLSRSNFSSVLNDKPGWIPLSVIIGILFIVMFFVIGKSSQKAGISITTVASKMSVVSPIVFSIIIDPADEINITKSLGIITALLAVALTVYRKRTLDIDRHAVIYPLILFFGMGLVDSLVKFAQLKYIDDGQLAIFTAILFLIAFLTGIIYMLATRSGLNSLLSIKVALWGIFLGLSNFGSIYFIIRALNFRGADGIGIDGSVVFGVNNTGIVLFSVIAGFIIFREKLQKINYLGILLALIAIMIFSYA